MRVLGKDISVALLVLFVGAYAFAALSAEDVYFGDCRHYSRPVEINAKKVFMAIPSYREIVEKSIPANSALYMLKLDEANKTFKRAVKAYAEENMCDLVCEEGRIKGASNITDEVIAKIETENRKK